MGRGENRNYTFGQKNHWRRTVWNEILRRTRGRELEQPILYLAGPQDNDRSIAIEKGVPPHNLIGVDLSAENVQRVRRSGGFAIEAEMLDVLWSWPSARPVCAVVLDYCSGIEWVNANALDPMLRLPFMDSIFAGNFQRGRDRWSNGRRRVVDASLDPELCDLSCDRKHRGWQFLASDAIEVASLSCQRLIAAAIREIEGDEDEAKSLEETAERGEAALFLDDEGACVPGIAFTAAKILTARRPRLFTYKSGVLTFDSFVCESYLSPNADREAIAESFEQNVVTKRSLRESDVSRRVAATLAVRTRSTAT